MIVKICGITNIADAQFAEHAGADWIGLNLVGGPRQIDLQRLKEISSSLEDVGLAVALVRVTDHEVDASLLSTLWNCGIGRLQLYGDTTAKTFEKLTADGFESILVQSVSAVESLDALDALLTNCMNAKPGHVLLDAEAPGQLGGTGKRLDWKQLGEERAAGRFDFWPPVVLAGGLTPENVAEAIRRTNPAGVDVSSGVESAPGQKDHMKIAPFVLAAAGA